MGAGVAAGPHCPVASNPAWEARRSALGGFENSASEPGALLPLPPESIHGRSRFQVSPLAPRPGPKPWRFAAWQIWNLRSSSRLRDPGSRSFGFAAGGILGRNLGSARRSMDRNPWSANSQLPGRNPVLPDRSGPKPFSAGGDALTEIPLSAGLVLDPKVRCPACRFLEPEGSRFRWALHEACRFRIR
jgi:hypothetical protein